jgi:hypothetical protein
MMSAMNAPEFSNSEVLQYVLADLKEQMCCYREQLPPLLLAHMENLLGNSIYEPSEELERAKFTQWLLSYEIDKELRNIDKKLLWEGWQARAKQSLAGL